MKPLKVKVSITLDEEVVLKVKKLAEYDDRSFSQYINFILRKHVSCKGDGTLKDLLPGENAQPV